MNDEQMMRYARHILMDGIGFEGQEKLNTARVLVFGMGGLGSIASMYLTSSGVGHLTLVDFDQVELSNLSRQIVHREQNLGQDKVESARQTLLSLNSTIKIETVSQRLTTDELQKVVEPHDVVVDCTDNFEARFAVNDACQAKKVPLVSGAVIRAEGQVTTFDFANKDSPNYESLYPRNSRTDDSCANSGVLSPVVGVVGSLQATEVVKLITGFGEPLIGQLLLLDAFSMKTKKINLNN